MIDLNLSEDFYVAFYRDGTVKIATQTRRIEGMGLPTKTQMIRSFPSIRDIHQADRIIAVKVDGSVEVLKDRHEAESAISSIPALTHR